jgi:hypothetical protein
MDLGIGLIISNIGISFEAWIVIVLGLGLLASFFAKSVQLGLLAMFLGYGAVFLWFYETTNTAATSLNYILPLVLCLICLVLLSLSLFITHKQAQRGGIV